MIRSIRQVGWFPIHHFNSYLEPCQACIDNLFPGPSLLTERSACHFFYSFVPESARWLIAKKKFDKAEKIVLKAAKVNGKSDKLPQNFIQELQETDTLVGCESRLK